MAEMKAQDIAPVAWDAIVASALYFLVWEILCVKEMKTYDV